jgi:pimeloyl-[acyl-carrier protein] synthase
MPAAEAGGRPPSLYRLLDPDVLADPYPLYRELREWDPVAWDPFLHCWVVTSYAGVVEVLHKFSADRTPTPEQLTAMGLQALGPVAEVMVRQMLFMDAPTHTKIRGLCSQAFMSRKVDHLRPHIQDIADGLLGSLKTPGEMDVIADFANPLPAIVTAELLGVPTGDHEQLKAWSADFAEMLGNFQHNPDRVAGVLRSLKDMTSYFQSAVRHGDRAGGLIHLLREASESGSHLSEDEVVANVIVTMVGGQETTTNLIGNGLLTLIRNPAALSQLRDDPSIIEEAVEELLRYESPSQHTARLAPRDLELGGKSIRQRDAVMAVMAAANRDPLRFPDPDRLDLTRTNNRHVAFGWAAHYCFGAPLARIEGQIAFTTLLRRLPGLALAPGANLEWRQNLGLRGLVALPVVYAVSAS